MISAKIYMMNSQKSKWANPNKLLLAWYLLQLPKIKEKSIDKSKFGKDFIRESFSKLTSHKIITLSELESLLRGFIEDDLILDMYEERMEYNEEKDSTTSKGIEHITPSEVGFFDPDAVVISNTLFINYDLKINEKKLVSFANGYLEKWKNDELFLPDTNLLKTEKQIKTVVKHIYYLLDEYPKKMLLVDWLKPVSEKIDFVATMLFLEGLKDIAILKFEIKSLLFGEKKGAFRVNVKDKFFQDFKGEWWSSLDFDFEKLKNGKDEKEEKVEKITFHPPKLLKYKVIEYEIKEGCIPQNLLILVNKKGGKAILQNELEQATGERKDRIKKALNNFRRNLRNKFGLQSDEPFFEQKAGEIKFKEELFQF